VVVGALFLYTFAIRTRGISDHFLMLGDQVRDWSVALRSFRDLPLVGPPSAAGNNSFGPIFYWVLWVIRVTIGPWVDNLPHAGGLGLSLVQSVADGVLYLGIRQRSQSRVFALASVLIIASSPFDLALSGTIWNPVLAVAFCKIATGLILYWDDVLTPGRRIVVLGVAWLAAQAHISAVPFAGALFAWIIGRHVRLGVRGVAAAAVDAALVVALLQVPSLLDTASIQPVRVTSAWTHVSRLRPIEAFSSLGASFEVIALAPWHFQQVWLVLLGTGTALLLALGPLAAPVAASVLPIAAIVVALSTWQDAFDSYWFLTVVPAGVLTIVWTLRLLPSRPGRSVAAALLLAAAVLAQAPRRKAAEAVFRLPAYGALVQGSRTIAARGVPVRRIEAPFLPPLSDPGFVFTILGGQIRPDAPEVATLSESGDVSFDSP
jgi:hypothetical protein